MIILISASGEHDTYSNNVKHHFNSILKMVNINEFSKLTGISVDDIRLAFTRENDYRLGPVKNELKELNKIMNKKTTLATEGHEMLMFLSKMETKKINQFFVKESYYQALRRIALLFIPTETFGRESEEKIKKILKKEEKCCMTKPEMVKEFAENQQEFMKLLQTPEVKKLLHTIKKLA